MTSGRTVATHRSPGEAGIDKSAFKVLPCSCRCGRELLIKRMVSGGHLEVPKQLPTWCDAAINEANYRSIKNSAVPSAFALFLSSLKRKSWAKTGSVLLNCLLQPEELSMENMFTALLMGAIAFLIPIVYVGIMCKISNPFVLERKK